MSDQETLFPLTSSAAGSPAKTSAQRDAVSASSASGLAFGSSTSESFANFDPSTSSWRTSQLSLSGDLTLFSDAWPSSGTMRSGRCSQRAPWVPHTHESACFSLPTPTASDALRVHIIGPRMRTIEDARGKPRKVNSNGSIWSLSLPLLWRRATGTTLRPRFVEWLMGFEAGWTITAFAHSVTPSSRKSRKSSGG